MRKMRRNRTKVYLATGLVFCVASGLVGLWYAERPVAGNDTATLAPDPKLTPIKSQLSANNGAHDVAVGDIEVDQLLALTNEYRRSKGVATLALSDKLHASAQDKCDDMVKRTYWAHNTPDGQEPWVFIKKYIPNYRSAGENLAMGFNSSAAIVASWQNSPEHDKNLLDTRYNQVGFAVCKSEKYVDNRPEVIVVQHFVGF